jgi:hypothetical protein
VILTIVGTTTSDQLEAKYGIVEGIGRDKQRHVTHDRKSAALWRQVTVSAYIRGLRHAERQLGSVPVPSHWTVSVRGLDPERGKCEGPLHWRIHGRPELPALAYYRKRL